MLVSFVQLNTALKHRDKLIWWIFIMIPENIISWDNTRSDCLPFADFQEENDIVLAVVDHLIGDLAEQFCHAVISIVITSDGVDHLDAVHQTREGLFDCVWISIVQRFDEFL